MQQARQVLVQLRVQLQAQRAPQSVLLRVPRAQLLELALQRAPLAQVEPVLPCLTVARSDKPHHRVR
jgi:hypothetical protein